MRARGASIRPARNQPPTRPKTSRNAEAAAAFGAKARSRSDRFGTKSPGASPPGVEVRAASGTYRNRNNHTTARSRAPATMRKPA
jgi:hypothetical protein